MRSIRGQLALAAATPLPTLLVTTGVLLLVPRAGAGPTFGPEVPAAAINVAPAPSDSAAGPTATTTGPAASSAAPTLRRADDRPLGPSADRGSSPSTGAAPTSAKPKAASGWLARTGAALALVVSLIFTLKWAVTRLARRRGLAGQLGAGGRAPSGVLEILGRYPVSRGVSLVLLRLDRRILLLSQHGSGFQTLTEIADPDEVASLIVQTRDDENASLARRFSAVLRSLERDPAIVGADPDADLDQQGPTSPRRAGLIAPAPDTWPEQVVEAPAADPVESLRRRVASLRASA